MNNTDNLIKNITGTNNYVKELEKVCGNMETIDKTWFVNQNKLNKNDDNTLRKTLIDTLGKDHETVKQYFGLSIKINFSSPYITIIKKSKKSKKQRTHEELRQELRPRVFIKSEFFKLLKSLEKTTNNLLEAFGKDGEKVENILKTQPELPNIKTFFGYKITKTEDVKPLKIIHDSSHDIISRYMLPMYDMKSTMNKNWGMLSALFKRSGNLSVGEFEVSQNEVKDMLYLFMVAKYRCTITENNKYYVKLFMNIINNNGSMEEETEFGKMDPARFLELLDTINLEAIDKKQKVYKFAEQSKNIIKRIVNKKEDESMEDIMRDVTNIIDTVNNQETTQQEQPKEYIPHENTNEYNDILNKL